MFLAKPKIMICENGQFSGHFVSDKKKCFWRKNNFYLAKQELWFFEKKNVFFWKFFSKYF